MFKQLGYYFYKKIVGFLILYNMIKFVMHFWVLFNTTEIYTN